MTGGNGNDVDDDLSSSSDRSYVTTIGINTSWSGSSSSNADDGSTDESENKSSSSSLASSASSSLVESAELDDDNDDREYDDCRWNNGDVDVDDNNLYSSGVRDWTEKVPIGMNLCPWAKLSQKEGRIKYVTCHEEIQTPQEASNVIWNEIETLLGNNRECNSNSERNRSLPPWSTTLVICPHVEAWKNDFEAFEAFVKNFGNGIESEQQPPSQRQSKQRRTASSSITLVPFHPHFVRWRGLPETISAGSKVRCHRGLDGFSKSPGAHPATVLDLRPPGFGRRRVRIRFHDTEIDPTRKTSKTEQCVPVGWVLLNGFGDDHNNNNNNHENNQRPPLPDNAMHRAPYPVVHILRNEDLEGLSIHEISRLKRRNAKRMASETLV
jgi:hypothetical protein